MRKITTLFIIFISSVLFSQNVQTITFEIWSNETWQNSAKTFYTYDNNDYLINYLYQLWDNSSNSYINYNQVNYTNNSNGTIQQYISQVWDNETSSWNNSQRATYSYDNNDEIITFENWSNEAWQNSAKTFYTHDNNDYLTNYLYQLWDNSSNSYVNYNQVNYTNNSNGTIQQYISQVWDNETSSWNNSHRATYSYENLASTNDYILNKIKFYPNPTSDNLYFSETTNVKLINSIGQIISIRKNTNSLSLLDLPSGTYFLLLTNNLGQVQQSKILKQ